MEKLEVYCNGLRDEVIRNANEYTDEFRRLGRIVGLTNIYLDIESDLIDFYESNFTNKEPIEIMESKLKDILEYIKLIK